MRSVETAYHDEKPGEVYTPGELPLVVRGPDIVMKGDGYPDKCR